MSKSLSQAEAEVKQVFPGTVNQTRADEAAQDILQALSNLQKRYRGHTINRSVLWEEMRAVVSEGLMAYVRSEQRCENKG